MNIKDIAISVLSVALVITGVFLFTQKVDVQVDLPLGAGASPEKYFEHFFNEGLTVGVNGSSLDAIECDTATWNPGSVSSSTAPASLAIANGTGAALGDIGWASFDSATSSSQWNVQAKVTAAASGSAEATTTIYLEGISGAAVDLSTSTARVCTLQF